MDNKPDIERVHAIAKADSPAVHESPDGDHDMQDAAEGGVPSAIQPSAGTRLQRRLRRAHRLEELKWKALKAERYVPRALELLRAIALGEDDDGNPVGADRLQLEALKDYIEMALGDLPSFTERVLKDDFVASVFEFAATAIRSTFGDLPDFEERMKKCALTFQQIILSSGVIDT